MLWKQLANMLIERSSLQYHPRNIPQCLFCHVFVKDYVIIVSEIFLAMPIPIEHSEDSAVNLHPQVFAEYLWNIVLKQTKGQSWVCKFIM